MDASQLWCPEIVHSCPKHKFYIFLCVVGYRNALRHSQTSFWVQWSRMDDSQLWYPEIVHLGPRHKFFIFLRSKVIAEQSKTQVLHLFTCRILAKCSETLPNILSGLME
jgi:hypothetical protein